METKQKLTFSQFIDLILVRLYEYENNQPGGFLNLGKIVNELKFEVPYNWVFDAGKILEGRGLAHVLFALGGTAMARISGEGRLYVEDEQGTGIIKDYNKDKGTFVYVSGKNNQVNVGNVNSDINQKITIKEERKPVFDLLDKIEEKLRSEDLVTKDELNDLLTDLASLRTQLEKKEPNKNVIAALLEPLSNITSIAGHVSDLINYLNV